MLFPVHIYDEGVELPNEGNYYVVAGNGVFLHKDTGLVKCFVPVDNISMLPSLEVASSVECSLPKLPAEHVQKIKKFFAEVVNQHRTESSTTLYFNPETSDWKVHVPQQLVSHGGVRYSRKLKPEEAGGYEGYLRVGTIHSHCDFGAFHSGTDVDDEKDFDGLHVTFGHNDRDNFTISASVVVNGHRSKVSPEDVLEGVENVESDVYKLLDDSNEEVNEWMEKVHTSGGRIPSVFQWKPRSTNRINEGDQVCWSDVSDVWKEKFGSGPFYVDMNEGGFMCVRTDVGLATFSKGMFKRYEE